jgi:hypothetical protein
MAEKEDCWLCPHLKALIECSMEIGTTETHALAQTMKLSEGTVNTYWRNTGCANLL